MTAGVDYQGTVWVLVNAYDGRLATETISDPAIQYFGYWEQINRTIYYNYTFTGNQIIQVGPTREEIDYYSCTITTYTVVMSYERLSGGAMGSLTDINTYETTTTGSSTTVRRQYVFE